MKQSGLYMLGPDLPLTLTLFDSNRHCSFRVWTRVSDDCKLVVNTSRTGRHAFRHV